ncbi:MAG: aminotransferase class I/II-fold pyridoxal phosphate-dependent enzyme [Polyangiaceae bacterium]
MLARSAYLTWAAQRYGRLRFDLAVSGMPAPPAEVLGQPPTEARPDPAEWLALRAAMARYNGVPEEACVAALGTTQAVWLACEALTSPGDEILVEAPGYEPLTRIAESVGAVVRTFDRPSRRGFALDAERVAGAMTPRTKLVVVSDPHNPSGVRAGGKVLRAVAGAVAARGARLLVDEVYAPFDGFVDARGVLRGGAAGEVPGILCAGSLGKAYGLGHARVGWLTGPAEDIARARDVILTTAGSLPLAHAREGLRALERIGSLADWARGRLGNKRERVARWVAEQGLRWSEPPGGLFGFVHLPGPGDVTQLVDRELREREVLVAPGAFFGEPGGFRLAWSADDAILDEGLTRLGDALRSWLPR